MIITYSQVHRTDKYSQHSSINWSVWLNSWVFVYKLSDCKFEFCCCHLKKLLVSVSTYEVFTTRQIIIFLRNFLGLSSQKTFIIMKNICLLKISLMKGKYFFLGNLPDEGKIFVYGKLFWWRKTSLMKEKYLFVENVLDNKAYFFWENFPDQEKVFARGKILWWRKNVCLWKTYLMKEKFLFDQRKIFSFWASPNISTGHRQKIELCTRKAASQRTQLSSTKIIKILL